MSNAENFIDKAGMGVFGEDGAGILHGCIYMEF